MTNMIDRAQVTEAVRDIISEALAVSRDRVMPNARIISDLQAESIDVADVRFRLEHHFNIRIDQRQMTVAIGAGLSAEEFDSNFTVQFIIDYVIGIISFVQ